MTTTPPPEPIPSVWQRRAARRSPQEQLFADTAGMRQAVVRGKARWIPDADAAVAAAVWEAIQRGATDWQALYDTARYAAVSHRRYELRHRRRLAPPAVEPPDLADRVADRVDAVRTVSVMRARVRAPEGDIAVWLRHKLDDDVAAEGMPNRVKNAGRRWAVRTRSKLRAVHEVA
jgi:hypothetical protein